MRQFQQLVFACSFRHHQICQTFHVRPAHFARWQAEMFLIQIKNIFACRQANVACSLCLLASFDMQIWLLVDLPQVYFQTPTNKREPKPQQNQSEERRRGGEIDLFGSISHGY